MPKSLRVGQRGLVSLFAGSGSKRGCSLRNCARPNPTKRDGQHILRQGYERPSLPLIIAEQETTMSPLYVLTADQLDQVSGGYGGWNKDDSGGHGDQVLFCQASAPHLQAFIDGFKKGGGTMGCPGGYR
jgi:hypothetical protein